MMAALVRSHQRDDGAFLSESLPGGTGRAGGNGAATALCLDALWPRREDPQLAGAISSALAFLEGCELAERPGHFCLQPALSPEGAEPARRPELDVTALIAVALHRYGRRSLADLQEIYRGALLPVRLEQITGSSEPWHDYDVFGSWLVPDLLENPVDVISNVHALVLLETLGQPMPEIPAIRLMLARGLDWAGSSKQRMQHLSPWHPEPVELLRALERADGLGVGGLSHMIGDLRRLDWMQRDLAADEPLALRGSGDGTERWGCALLRELRQSAPGTAQVRMLRRVK